MGQADRSREGLEASPWQWMRVLARSAEGGPQGQGQRAHQAQPRLAASNRGQDGPPCAGAHGDVSAELVREALQQLRVLGGKVRRIRAASRQPFPPRRPGEPGGVGTASLPLQQPCFLHQALGTGVQ